MSLAYLTEACAFLGDAQRAAQLYEMLLPFQHRLIVLVPVACYGPASHYLGLLSATTGDADGARRHFEAAIELSTQLGMKQYLARTQLAYAELQVDQGECGSAPRELLEQSLEICKSLDMPVLAERARAMLELCAQPPTAIRPRIDRSTNGRTHGAVQVPASNRIRTLTQAEVVIHLRREGRYWTFVRGDQITRLGDLKGVRYLQCLLRQPDVEFHVLLLNQLVNGPVPDASIWAAAKGDGPDGLHGSTFDEPLFDATGLRRIRAERARLEGEIEEADANNEFALASKLRAELEKLVKLLSEAYGYGEKRCGRSGQIDALRQAIQKAIKKVFDGIAPVDPYLEGHLRRNVKTGACCVYRPDPNNPVVWEFDTGRIHTVPHEFTLVR
jgi:hypothetical protein